MIKKKNEYLDIILFAQQKSFSSSRRWMSLVFVHLFVVVVNFSSCESFLVVFRGRVLQGNVSSRGPLPFNFQKANYLINRPIHHHHVLRLAKLSTGGNSGTCASQTHYLIHPVFCFLNIWTWKSHSFCHSDNMTKSLPNVGDLVNYEQAAAGQ